VAFAATLKLKSSAALTANGLSFGATRRADLFVDPFPDAGATCRMKPSALAARDKRHFLHSERLSVRIPRDVASGFDVEAETPRGTFSLGTCSLKAVKRN
jgi:hypothetical protein